MTLSPTSMSANMTNETTYQSGSECFGDSKFQSWIFFVILVSIPLIILVGILLNLFVLVVFCFHKKACTVPEIYLSNLAAADFLLMTSLLLLGVGLLNDYSSVFRCLIIPTIEMNSCCSSGFLVLVSIDRYLALVHPLSHERLRRPLYAKRGCLLVWILGFLLNVHHFIFSKLVQNPLNNVTKCDIVYPSMTAGLLFYGLFSLFRFFIPVCIMCFCTVKILKVLRNRIPERSNTENMERKATTLVLVVLLVFVICWLPINMTVIMFLFFIPPNECLFDFLVVIGVFDILLALLNSVLNPILYILVGKTFRKKVKEFFQQCRTPIT